MSSKIPFNEFPQTRLDGRGGRVTEDPPSLRYIRVGRRHIAGHRWERVDRRLFLKRGFNLGNYLAEFDRLTFSQVKDVERRTFVIYRGHHALDDILDIGEISARSPIAVDVYWFAAIN